MFLLHISDFAGSFVKAELTHLLQQIIDKKLNEISIKSDTYSKAINRDRVLYTESAKLTITAPSIQSNQKEQMIERNIERCTDPVLIFNNANNQSSLIKSIERNLNNVRGVKYDINYNRVYANIDNCIHCLGHLPIIHLTVIENNYNEITVSVSTWNLIPGNRDITSTQFSIVLDDVDYSIVVESIIYYINVLKGTYHLYTDSIANQKARLELEANLLYQAGYQEIIFNPCEIGYYIELPLDNNIITFFLPFNYPIEEPLIMVGEGKNAYEISFAEGIWRPSISISQIISAIDKMVG